MTLRGHTGGVFSVTGPKIRKDADASMQRVLFTGGAEGAIKVWYFPRGFHAKDYPETKGVNFSIGLWTDKKEEPVWQLEYHPFVDLLLSIKSDSSVQMWDCSDVAEKVKTAADDDFSTLLNKDAPKREFKFEVDDQVQEPTCCSWLPSDHNMFVAGYSSSHLVFFEHATGRSTLTVEADAEGKSPI